MLADKFSDKKKQMKISETNENLKLVIFNAFK